MLTKHVKAFCFPRATRNAPMPAEISTVGAIARANRRSLLLLSFHDRSLEARWASGPCHQHGSFYQQWMADRLEA